MSARITPYPGQLRGEAFAESFDDRLDIAMSIAQEARADAPVLTGDYRDGITVDTDGERVFVLDEDEDAIFKEYGTIDTPPHAVVTNAASRHGEYSGWRPR
ncbi:HK97 gp10 family phage protein [Rhodococcus sp. IC4_135]|uniref:HK97 gp10 family phage protein n=1 Tax=Rhodococcus sp. IC4_135 TaxID=2715537 RepID=UPI0014206316|nr:HK97 gp10 family phage protein [Rhodococcus sp. IC4_135]